ncbi:riboflavin synthase [Altericroceibacterium endophyticum]|uniref:Riboflavin synthase n=1 Tax=Altericroceibacterium endophyticum TaxID=1808508 RepID=A0A6I4T800_9SPHN|nr:riboflavin synthase [Altericroceibacterium endophyticum]MXO65925.1 riboflavin synthase [Altericroceibacterium endophyticum]
MFTGIITATGTITHADQRGDLRIVISCPFDPAMIVIGASIACSGVCLTVVERGGSAGDAWFAVDVSAETLSCTAPGMWDKGSTINLEPSLKIGDELGGHIVSGHVDAVGTLISRETEGDSTRLVIQAPADLAPFIAPKGSITVDGISLTVNSVEDQADRSVLFGLNIIPHTAEVTTLGSLVVNDPVNLEIDTVARYLQRMQSLRS